MVVPLSCLPVGGTVGAVPAGEEVSCRVGALVVVAAVRSVGDCVITFSWTAFVFGVVLSVAAVPPRPHQPRRGFVGAGLETAVEVPPPPIQVGMLGNMLYAELRRLVIVDLVTCLGSDVVAEGAVGQAVVCLEEVVRVELMWVAKGHDNVCDLYAETHIHHIQRAIWNFYGYKGRAVKKRHLAVPLGH